MSRFSARVGALATVCALVAAGCFSPGDAAVETSAEAAALSRSLLRALGANNAQLLDEPLAEPEPSTVRLVLEPTALAIAPGDTGKLSITVIGLPEGARIAATLISWPHGDSHLEVPRVSTSAEDDSQIEFDYEVGAGVCSRLCDRVLTADLVLSVALSDGRTLGRLPFSAELDCREHGNQDLCDLPPDSPPLVYGQSLDDYRAQYCACHGMSCDVGDVSFASACVEELLAAHPEEAEDLALCMASRLDRATECLETACDFFGCTNAGNLAGMTVGCGLEAGELSDELLDCFLSRRPDAGLFRCNPGFELQAQSFCDGSQDCEGGFDELACPRAVTCAPSFFEVQPAWICNGFPDCPDNLDEQSCPAPSP